MVRKVLSAEMLTKVNYNGKGLSTLSGSELKDKALAFGAVRFKFFILFISGPVTTTTTGKSN
uniref:Peripheral subunit-binding (PSBD) domain-containing protein n=1 Tax=Macrostomum lignano TaxID=282301 RepID=A0A1I8G3L3_9PLAT